MLKNEADRKVPLPRMHISGHDQKNTYCNSTSLYSVMTDSPEEANCKTCLALYNKDIGKIKIYPFGGRPRGKENAVLRPDAGRGPDGRFARLGLKKDNQ